MALASGSAARNAEADGRDAGAGGGGGVAPQRRGDSDEVRAKQKSSAFSQACSSAHQRHCSSFIYLYSWLLPAQRMKTAFTESSSLFGSPGAQASDSGHRSILVGLPAADTHKP